MIFPHTICFFISKRDKESLNENQILYQDFYFNGFHPYASIFRSFLINEICHYENQIPNYFEEDCFFINRWLGDDYSESVICPRCGNSFTSIQDYEGWQEPISHGWCHQIVEKAEIAKLPRKINFDSGVIGIVLDSALESIQYAKHKFDCRLPIDYKSEALKRMNNCPEILQLYEFMKSKHILIISKEVALYQPPEEWSKFAL